MAFDPEWRGLVPGRASLERIQDPNVGEAYQRAEAELLASGLDGDVPALSWVYRLSHETAHLNRVASAVPWVDRIAVGFFDPEIDATGPDFGLIAYSSLDPERLSPDNDPRRLGSDLGREIDEVYIPTVVRLGRRVPNIAIAAPNHALTTTWGRTGSGRAGYLLPHHAAVQGLGGPLASTVAFADGSSGPVLENWGDCIDAVLVGAAAPPATGPRVTCARGVAPGTDVIVTDQRGITRRAHVIDVDTNLGVVRGTLFAIRFAYDWSSSQPGDSGALVSAYPCMEPMGMHQGSIRLVGPSRNTVNRAYALCLYQLEDYGGLEVFQ